MAKESLTTEQIAKIKALHAEGKTPEDIKTAIFQCRKEGLSLFEIATRLNDLGVPSKKGGKWHAATLAHIVNNDLYREPPDNLIPWTPPKKPAEPAETKFMGQLVGVVNQLGDNGSTL